MLEHWSGRRKGDSIRADSYLYTQSKEWKLNLLPAGSPADGKFKAGLWALVNAESECALDHFGMKSVQAYSPGPMKDESRQWRIMEVSLANFSPAFPWILLLISIIRLPDLLSTLAPRPSSPHLPLGLLSPPSPQAAPLSP